jgi:hypothetical protein
VISRTANANDGLRECGGLPGILEWILQIGVKKSEENDVQFPGTHATRTADGKLAKIGRFSADAVDRDQYESSL